MIFDEAALLWSSKDGLPETIGPREKIGSSGGNNGISVGFPRPAGLPCSSVFFFIRLHLHGLRVHPGDQLWVQCKFLGEPGKMRGPRGDIPGIPGMIECLGPRDPMDTWVYAIKRAIKKEKGCPPLPASPWWTSSPRSSARNGPSTSCPTCGGIGNRHIDLREGKWSCGGVPIKEIGESTRSYNYCPHQNISIIYLNRRHHLFQVNSRVQLPFIGYFYR